MKINIRILNLTKFHSGEEERIRIGYVFADDDAVSNNDKFKGYREYSAFSSNTKAFDLIKLENLLMPAVAHLIEKPMKSDPLKSRKVIEKIDVNGVSVSLL